MTTIIAELSTNHGGDIELACDMVRAAADAGCTYAKVQSYSLAKLNPRDAQADWLRQSHLDREDHERLIVACQDAGIRFLSTPFDAESLKMLRALGLHAFKVASSESGHTWWTPEPVEHWFVSWPWGNAGRLPPAPFVGGMEWHVEFSQLTAIPLYPTPLEAVGRATLLDGWSDHTVGLAACQWAIAHGARVIEAHMALPDRGRRNTWDKLPAELRQLRTFADEISTMTTGVATRFRERWTA
jgi:N,N'-diacetyllegionaminate synthase